MLFVKISIVQYGTISFIKQTIISPVLSMIKAELNLIVFHLKCHNLVYDIIRTKENNSLMKLYGKLCVLMNSNVK